MKRVFSLIIGFFCISMVFGLTINEPQDIYQLGDKLFVTTTELKGYPSGNLNVDLLCGNATVNLLKISARAFSEEGGQSYSIPYKVLSTEDLEIEDLNSIVGSCFMRANLASEVIETKHFTITKDLQVVASIDKVQYNPGEDVIVSLEAKRADGTPFNGYYAFSNFTKKSGNFSGETEITFSVKETMAPGEYFLQVDVFDEDNSGEIMNNGSEKLFVVVNQVPTRVESALATSEVVPGEALRLNPQIVDQVGTVMPGGIAIHVVDPNEHKFDYASQSGQEFSIPFKTNATKGDWKIYTVAGTLTQDLKITVLGVERVNYTFENSVLRITNIGNIDYFGEADIKIGDITESVEVKLGVGESKEFIIEAPEGEYEISVNDGENSFSGTGFLTGNAISIREVGTHNLAKRFSLVWVFLLFLVGSFGIVMMGVYKRTRVVGDKTTFKEKLKGWGGRFRPIRRKEEKKPDMIDLANQKKITSAQSALVLQGEKTQSSVVAIKLVDKDSFNDDIQHEIIQLIKEVSGAKGVVDVKEDIVYMIFSPLITKSFQNDRLAVKIALLMKSKLDEYKKKLSGELKYGIGVHNGDLVAEKTQDTLRYTSIGNTLSLVNKIAQDAENEVFISQKVRHSMMRDVKVTEKKDFEGTVIYKVSSMIDRGADHAKLKDLLHRMGDKNPNS